MDAGVVHIEQVDRTFQVHLLNEIDKRALRQVIKQRQEAFIFGENQK